MNWNSLKEFWNNRTKGEKITIYIVLALVAVLLCTMAVNAIIGIFRTNIVKNGSFESWSFGKPTGWSVYDYRKDYQFDTNDTSYGKDGKEAVVGNSSICLESKDNDIRFYQDVEVKASTYYKITASFKVEGVIEAGQGANISIYDEKIAFPEGQALTTDGEWKTFTVYGKTGENQVMECFKSSHG